MTAIARAQVATISANLAGTLTGTTDGTIVDVAAIVLSTGDVYSDLAVKNAVNTAVTSINLQHKELQAKLNEAILKLNDTITALQNKGVVKA